jgi:hypothetical protein
MKSQGKEQMFLHTSHKHWLNAQPCEQTTKHKLAEIGLYNPLDGVTKPKYRLLPFLTNIFLEREGAFNFNRCFHLFTAVPIVNRNLIYIECSLGVSPHFGC